MTAETLTFAVLLGAPEPLSRPLDAASVRLGCIPHVELYCAVLRWWGEREGGRELLPHAPPATRFAAAAAQRAHDLSFLNTLLDDLNADDVTGVAPALRELFLRCLEMGKRPYPALIGDRQ